MVGGGLHHKATVCRGVELATLTLDVQGSAGVDYGPVAVVRRPHPHPHTGAGTGGGGGGGGGGGSVFATSAPYLSGSGTDEGACSLTLGSASFPIKVVTAVTLPAAVGGGGGGVHAFVHRIRTSRAMAKEGHLSWQGYAATRPELKAAVEVVFAEPFDAIDLYVDEVKSSTRHPCGGELGLDTPPGGYSYCPDAADPGSSVLSFIMHAAQRRYKWVGKVNPKVNLAVVLQLNLQPARTYTSEDPDSEDGIVTQPPDTEDDAVGVVPPEAQALIVDAFASAMMYPLAEQLGIPLDKFKVVCVHEVGRPCLKAAARARARARREVPDDGAGGRGFNASAPLKFEWEVENVNAADDQVDEQGQQTAAYAENLAFVGSVKAGLEDLTLSGDIDAVVANASIAATELAGQNPNMTNISLSSGCLGVSMDSALSADDTFEAVAVGGKLVKGASVGGTILADGNGNGIADANSDAPLAGVVVSLTRHDGGGDGTGDGSGSGGDGGDSGVVRTTTTGADGSWAFAGVELASYSVAIDSATLPARTSPYAWRRVGTGVGDDALPAKGAFPPTRIEHDDMAGFVLDGLYQTTVAMAGRVVGPKGGGGLGGVTVVVKHHAGGEDRVVTRYASRAVQLHPHGWSTRFRLAPRTYALCGSSVRVASLTKSRMTYPPEKHPRPFPRAGATAGGRWNWLRWGRWWSTWTRAASHTRSRTRPMR